MSLTLRRRILFNIKYSGTPHHVNRDVRLARRLVVSSLDVTLEGASARHSAGAWWPGRDLATIVAAIAPAFVPLSASVPTMVVVEPAAIAFPIAGNEPPPVVIGLNPVPAREGRSRPVARVPHPASADRIPVAVDPHEIGTWLRRHARWTQPWRRPDRDAERNLSAGRRCGSKEQGEYDERLQEVLHIIGSPSVDLHPGHDQNTMRLMLLLLDWRYCRAWATE